MSNVVILNGDCTERMLTSIEPGTVDAIVCDPPYGLRFMNKAFDDLGDGASQRLWHKAWLDAAMVALKPGGVIKAFSGTRTYHHLAYAMDEAGFERLPLEAWIYSSGFPKSLNISKAIDKMKGAQREKIRVEADKIRNPKSINGGHGVEGGDRPWMMRAIELGYHEIDSSIPVTDEAKLWEGWGTALKPAWEPVIVGRKPAV